MAGKIVITEAQFEQWVDARVQRVLARDRAYRNAEFAEQQAIREQEITDQIVAEYEAAYEVQG